MKNPLRKRILREFFGEFGKYLAIFLFMAATISFVSGFLVASGSMKKTYDESFERYHIEDGHFVLKEAAEDELIEKAEKEHIKIYKDFYYEEEADVDSDGEKDGVLRIFGERKEVNQVCLLSGELPADGEEIALDRMYAENNDVAAGDVITVAGSQYRISGLIALSDYSALYQNNNDLMFDAKMFGVAIMTEDAIRGLGTVHKNYNYAWTYDKKPEDETAEKETAEELSGIIATEAMAAGNSLEIFLPGFLNRAIHFAGDDMGKDRPMMTVLLYILIIIMAFVFAVSINHTVVREANVIGTLRASGYTKRELFIHYLTVPAAVTLLAAITGNVIGYTCMEDVAKNMYLGSYSLTAYESVWNADAFVKTTVIPMILMLLTTSISLWKKLSFSPLQFLRRDLVKKGKKKALKLPNFSFFTRFRIRIIIQNLSGYVTLFAGILFANLILMFGMIMTPILDGYGEQAIAYQPAKYQYVLSSTVADTDMERLMEMLGIYVQTPGEIPQDIAEKYCVTALKMQDDYYDEEEINIYGLQEDSRYYDLSLPENGVTITSDMAKKYRLKKGDIINLKEQYGNHIYAFAVQDIFEYPTCLGIYMSMEEFNETFDHDDGYYNGYFSNEKLEGTYLKEDDIANCITEEDLTKLSRQMDISMGEMFGLVSVFAIILFALLIYLLTRLILEKNASAISMVKILGYRDYEIASLYIVVSIWVVIVSSVLALAFNTWLFQIILRIFLKGYGGWFNLDISFQLYAEMFLMMVGTYLIVAVFQFCKIRKIPMDEALKNVE